MKVIGVWVFLLLMHVESRFLSLVTELFLKVMSLTNGATKAPVSVKQHGHMCCTAVLPPHPFSSGF